MSLSLSFLTGILLAIQSPLTVNLGRRINSPILANLNSYFIGVLEYLVILLILGKNPLTIIANAFNHGSYNVLGGVLGSIYITSLIVLFPILGPVRAVVFPTLGQIGSGLIIDGLGLLGVQKSNITILVGLGFSLLLIGVLLTSYKKTEINNDVNVKLIYFWSIVAFIGGILSTLQNTLNGNLSQSISDPFGATFFAQTAGAIAVTVYTLVTKTLNLESIGTLFKTPIAWFTATLGITFVSLMTFLVPQLGPSITISLSIIGSMIGSTLIEHFGWLGVTKNNVTAIKIVGIVVFIVGILFVKGIIS